MARKQRSRGLNRFLDLIGLVDSEHEEDMEQEASASARRSSSARRTAEDEFDGFDEQSAPRSRTAGSTQTARARSRVNLESDDEFGEDQGWSTARPASARTTASRRTTAQSTRAQTSSSYQSAASYGAARTSGYRSSSSAYDAARSSGYRAAESQPRYTARTASGSYSSSGRWSEDGYSAQETPRPSYQRHQTVIFSLRSVDECKDVILALIDKKSVLLNLDALDSVQAQRALDTMSGATFAIGATLSRASDRTWLIAPSNVEVERSSMEERDYV